tara:strand:+ start:7072 stop:12255 length:5184 start_codon:yes stop_codon:yes gene_type:complete
MACKYNAPNGKKSELYDSLYKIHGHKTALKAWVNTQTQEFKDWHNAEAVAESDTATSNTDINGEPVVYDGTYYENANGERRDVIILDKENPINLEAATEQIESLTNIFKKSGIEVEIQMADIQDAGQIVSLNGNKATITFNPRKLRKDTVFHEYGHAYVDLLGNARIVEKGIDNLRGSKLWSRVALLYPELSEAALGKEVLTTAIGIEAAKLYDERVRIRNLKQGSITDKIKGWSAWFKNAVKQIASRLGISRDISKRLAYELTGSKFRRTLTGRLSKEVQKQKTIAQILTESKGIHLTKDGSHYISPLTKKELRRVTTALEDIKGKFPRAAVIAKLVASNKPEWVQFTDPADLAMFWADKREEGTAIHNIAEDYINGRNEGLTRRQAIKKAMDGLTRDTKEGFDEDGVRFYSGRDPDKVAGYIDNIADFIDGLIAKGYTLYPEVKIFDDEMGLAGTIDLLIKKPNGKWMIYDWKTKERGKFKDFYNLKTSNGAPKMFDGLMSDMQQTQARDYSLQLSTYRLMLERQGFVFEEKESLAIIPLVGVAEITNDPVLGNETHYRDVGMETNVQGLNKDGVLPLESLVERLKDVYEVKDDVEKFLEENEENEKEMESMAMRIYQMTHIEKWLKDMIINLEKSVSRIRAAGDTKAAARFEKGIKALIDEIDVVDNNMAIAAYTRYVQSGVAEFYERFRDKIGSVEDANGVVSKQMIKGYDSWSWQDIKHLETTNPKKYLEFLGFMINARMFMDQIIEIRNLPLSVGAEINVVHQTLKMNEMFISDIDIKLNRLNKELDKRYNEISSNPLYGGRGVLHDTEGFVKAQVDERFFQRTMDAMADTHNSYMANVQRMYDYKLRMLFDDQQARLKEWDRELTKLENSGSSVDKFVDKKTGRIITRINWTEYKAARRAMYKEANTHKIGSPEYNRITNEFFNEHVEPIPAKEREAIIKQKRKELIDGKDETAFIQWLDSVTYIGKNGRVDKKQGMLYRPSSNMYTNPTYASYSAKEIEFQKYLTSLLAELTEHTKSSVVKDGYAPAVPTNQKKFMEQFLHNIGYRGSGIYDADKGVIVNEAGEVVQFIPFMYNNLLHQKPLNKIDPKLDASEQKKMSDENKKIRAENEAAHAASTEQDLSLTMPIFIRTALKHKHKSAMEFELLRVKHSFERNHKILEVKNGIPVVDKFRKMKDLEDNKVEKTTVGSNVLDHYTKWLKMNFYEDFELDQGTFQKVARVLQNYTSFKSMALNPLSALNNQVYGEIMTAIESAAGEFFNPKDWAWSSKEYLAGVPSFFADDADSFKFSSKQSAIFHHIPIMMDFKELALNENVEGSMGNVALQKAGNALSKCYFMEHLSEHNLQNRVLLSMMRSHKVIDGVITSFTEYSRNKLEDITYKEVQGDTAQAKQRIEANKAKLAVIKEEWKKIDSLYDSYELVEGELKLKGDIVLKENEIAEFQRRVLGVNQYLHGIYNKEDAGTMQAHVLGRLSVQFRKWMRPGWNKRFGSQFGKSFWNERRSMLDEGMYVTTFNFLTKPIAEGIKNYKEANEGDKREMTIMKALGNISRDYARYLVNVRLHWHTLTPTQQANVIRTIFEYLAFSMSIGVAMVLKHIKGEDDDPPLPLMIALYQADRTATELTTYVPLAVTYGFIGGGWLNESKKMLKSPTATFNTMEAAIRISKELIFYPFASSEDLKYKGGVYHGENKLGTMTKKMTPLWNQHHKFTHLSKNYKYYKLFGN